VPTLMLHGSRDQRATLAQATSVFEALAGPKRLCVFEGAEHEQLLLADRTLWDTALDEHLMKFQSIGGKIDPVEVAL
jgi:alpha-beta hydrolase superfamily lysophospholipase